MVTITVLVTGVGGGGVGRQVLKSLRQAEVPYRIIGTDMTEISMGLYEVDKHYILPPASAGKAYTGMLLWICQDEHVQVIIPGSEPELLEISRRRDQFTAIGVLPLINNTEVLRVCMDKGATCGFLFDHGFPCALFSLGAGLDAFPLPAVIKPTVASGGSLNVYLAQTKEEMEFFIGYLRSQGLTPLVQEYVGSYEEEYTVGVLTDMMDGTVLGSMALRRHILSGLSNRIRAKNRHKDKIDGDLLVLSSGISQGVVDDYPEVRRVCEKIATTMGSRGPMNFQCRKDGDEVFVFEINPRFSGTTYMRTMLGYNEPDILIRRHILGEDVRLGEYKKGLVMRGLQETYIPRADEVQ